MEQAETIGIDLPLKALVWRDATGAAWLSCKHPNWLAERHRLSPQPTAALNVALEAVATTATIAK
jgi:uncharacterized protein (DUF302 family)